MKTTWAALVLAGGLAATCAQDVFVLGGPGSTPVPPIVYQPPIYNDATPAVVYQPVALAGAAVVPVVPAYGSGLACASPRYNANVLYVGGAATGSYYPYSHCNTPNVIYFGRGQAYRQGYSFGSR